MELIFVLYLQDMRTIWTIMTPQCDRMLEDTDNRSRRCAKVCSHLSYILLYINSCLQVIRHYVILGMHPPPVCILLAKTPQFQMYQTLQDGSTITRLVSEHTSIQSTPLRYSSICRVHGRSTYPVMLPFIYYPVSRYH